MESILTNIISKQYGRWSDYTSFQEEAAVALLGASKPTRGRFATVLCWQCEFVSSATNPY
jgi:hypothetical protein